MRVALLVVVPLLVAWIANAEAYRVTNNPYNAVDWNTTLRCQSQHHDHDYNSSRITDLSNAGYCAVAYMHYTGLFQPNTLANWNILGDPVPDPGFAVGWDYPRHWPAEDFGAPALPLNSLKFYIPGSEEIGLVGGNFASPTQTEHFFALGLTVQMEGVGCAACSASGPNTYGVHNDNPNSLPAGQLYTSSSNFVAQANALGAIVTLNHPAGAPTAYDSLTPFPAAVEIYNNYHANSDDGTGGSCGGTLIADMQAIWDHVLETKSARIWGVSVNDWASAWTPLGAPYVACWPTSTATNMDRGKMEVLLPVQDLSSYLTAWTAGAFFSVVEDNATKSAYPQVTDIVVTETAITLTTAATTETVTWIGDGATQGTGMSISLLALPADLQYLRAELDDGAGRILFTQPFELGATTRGLTGGTIRGGTQR